MCKSTNFIANKSVLPLFFILALRRARRFLFVLRAFLQFFGRTADRCFFVVWILF